MIYIQTNFYIPIWNAKFGITMPNKSNKSIQCTWYLKYKILNKKLHQNISIPNISVIPISDIWCLPCWYTGNKIDAHYGRKIRMFNITITKTCLWKWSWAISLHSHPHNLFHKVYLNIILPATLKMEATETWRCQNDS